jgi:hypothetical protein
MGGDRVLKFLRSNGKARASLTSPLVCRTHQRQCFQWNFGITCVSPRNIHTVLHSSWWTLAGKCVTTERKTRWIGTRNLIGQIPSDTIWRDIEVRSDFSWSQQTLPLLDLTLCKDRYPLNCLRRLRCSCSCIHQSWPRRTSGYLVMGTLTSAGSLALRWSNDIGYRSLIWKPPPHFGAYHLRLPKSSERSDQHARSAYSWLHRRLYPEILAGTCIDIWKHPDTIEN